MSLTQPDIIAPGSNILAAWSPVASLYWSEKYAIISGTSMACPHISGIVALIKSVHPEWSPAAIKSALVTTGAYFNPLSTLICIWGSLDIADHIG